MKFQLAKKRDWFLLPCIPLVIIMFFAFSYFLSTINNLSGGGVLSADLVSNRNYDFSRLMKPRAMAIIDGNLANRNDDSMKTYGMYSSFTGVVSSDKLLNQKDYENLRLEVLRHEYGHVLMEDLIDRKFTTDFPGFLQAQLVFTSTKLINQSTGDLVADTYPPELRKVYDLYKKYGKAVYGSQTYDADNFAEFFAQGFSVFIANYKMPSDLFDAYAAIATMN